ANHHGGERVSEFALEHRAFASNYAVVAADFAEQEWRIHIGKIDLARALEIALAAVEILAHHAEIDVASAQDVAHLAQHFLHANVGAGVARAVVAGKEQAEFFAGLPAATEAKGPAEAPDFDQRTDPSDEKEIGHARALPAIVFGVTPREEGQGLAG